MLQNKPLTAEEWLLNHKEFSCYDLAEHDEGGYLGINEPILYRIMQEYLKYHMPFIIKAVQENSHIQFAKDWIRKSGRETIYPNSLVDKITPIIDKQSIENSINDYVKNNIK